MTTCQSTYPSSKSIALEAGGQDWTEAVEQLRDRLADVEDGADAGAEELVTFSPAWARTTQARLLGVDDRCRDWANATALLTPTASRKLPGSDVPVPPLEHLRAIRMTRSARQPALSRALADIDRWRAVRVLGPTESGYITPHVGVYLSESVERERFRPWVRAHVQGCDLADLDAHGEDSVVIERSPNSSDKTGLVNYLMANVPGCDTRGDREHGLADEPAHRWQAGAVIRASEWEPVSVGRPSGQSVD